MPPPYRGMVGMGWSSPEGVVTASTTSWRQQADLIGNSGIKIVIRSELKVQVSQAPKGRASSLLLIFQFHFVQQRLDSGHSCWKECMVVSHVAFLFPRASLDSAKHRTIM